VGYTDETPVVRGSQLEKALQAGLEAGDDTDPSAYNKVLSKFRAATLNDYVVQRIKAQLDESVAISIESNIVGRGEALPKPDVAPPYQRQDSRRRICILSPFIEIVP
jgi:hypothetical protein